MLEVKGIETSYGTSQVLFGMSFSVNEGEVVSLLGRNGMGKTTTIRSLMGMVPTHGGSITFEGKEVQNLKDYQIAKLGLGLVPEGRQIFPNLTVRENLIATAANRTGTANPWEVDHIVDMFPNLGNRMSNMGNQLSGGEQQMLAVGRALMTNPKLLILDEATEGLAPLIREEIWKCLEGLKERGQSILVIDKNVDALTRIGDRHYIVERGQIVWEGNSAELSSNEELQHRYLGV
ncbi:MAG: branched-chain amino acid transport system ATP-binding protein [Paracoccaceae bacterium]|jgi:branched-chain amino acid transport system ATP-binding protein